MSFVIACGGTSKFMAPLSLPPSFNSFVITQNNKMKKGLVLGYWGFSNTRRNVIVKASSDVASPSIWENWKNPKSFSTLSFSGILWPSAGAFVAVAILGKLDQLLTPKELTITIALLGAVSALLFASPSAPSTRKHQFLLSSHLHYPSASPRRVISVVAIKRLPYRFYHHVSKAPLKRRQGKLGR
ncbi:unnamed protein product [Lathyrus sativus]|nr:unnamed protein product [Lathyrus sativus]